MTHGGGPGALRITTAVRLASARRENASSRSTIMTCAQAFAHVRLIEGPFS